MILITLQFYTKLTGYSAKKISHCFNSKDLSFSSSLTRRRDFATRLIATVYLSAQCIFALMSLMIKTKRRAWNNDQVQRAESLLASWCVRPCEHELCKSY